MMIIYEGHGRRSDEVEIIARMTAEEVDDGGIEFRFSDEAHFSGTDYVGDREVDIEISKAVLTNKRYLNRLLDLVALVRKLFDDRESFVARVIDGRNVRIIIWQPLTVEG